VYDTLALWLLGYPDQALARSRDLIAAAEQISSSYTLAAAHYFCARFHQFRRDVELTRLHAETTLSICKEQGLPFFEAAATIFQGWAIAMQHHYGEGMMWIEQGWKVLQASQGRLWRAYFLACKAEACAANRQFVSGLQALDAAFAYRRDTEDCCWDAECYRLRGELLLAATPDAAPAAETCLQQALDIARQQQAKALELRAGTSLARLWHDQGNSAAARALLAPLHAWFSEGFDTSDLQEAAALLSELD
jgi:predicted ATPase